MVIRRVGVLSVGKIFGALYGSIALVIGAIISVVSIFGGAMAAAAGEGGEGAAGALVGMVIGVGAVVFLPILYGGVAFVMGVIAALLYNLFAGFVGGIEIELESGPTASAPPVQPITPAAT